MLESVQPNPSKTSCPLCRQWHHIVASGAAVVKEKRRCHKNINRFTFSKFFTKLSDSGDGLKLPGCSWAGVGRRAWSILSSVDSRVSCELVSCRRTSPAASPTDGLDRRNATTSARLELHKVWLGGPTQKDINKNTETNKQTLSWVGFNVSLDTV